MGPVDGRPLSWQGQPRAGPSRNSSTPPTIIINSDKAEISDPTDAQPIYDIARECERLFKQFPQDSKGKLGDKILASQRRFRSWAAYLGVFAVRRASLDTRLRFEPDVRDLTILLLDVLQTDLRRVTKLASKGHILRSNVLVKSDIVPGPADEHGSVPLSKEAAGALYGIVGSIDRLHRLAVRIRTSSKDDQKLEEKVVEFAKTLLRDNFKEVIDLILKYKFPYAGEDLIARLTKSIVFRRYRLLYQRHHYKKLSHDRQPGTTEVEQQLESKPVPVKTEKQEQQQRLSETDPATEKHPLNKSLEFMGDDQTARVSSTNPTLFRKDRFDQQGDDKAKHPTPTVFSVGSSWVGKINYPIAPKPEGTFTHAVCQFCFQELQIIGNKDPKWWERHVDRDMDHYICLSDECHQSLRYFNSFRSWLEHMESEHEPDWPRFIYPKSRQWRCTLSGDHTGSFEDVTSLEQHLNSFHSADFDVSDLGLLAQSSGFPQPRDPDICPLCQESIDSLMPAVQDQAPKTEGSTKKKRVVKFKDQSSNSSSGAESDGKKEKGHTASSIDPPKKSTSKMARHIAKHLKSVSFLSLRGFEPQEEDERDDSSGARVRESDHSTFDGSIAFEDVSQESDASILHRRTSESYGKLPPTGKFESESWTWNHVHGESKDEETAPAVFDVSNTSRGDMAEDQSSSSSDRARITKFVVRDDDGNDVEEEFAKFVHKFVLSQFSNIPDTVAKRLTETMMLRRKRILWRRGHESKLTPDPAIKETKISEEARKAASTRTFATTIHPSSLLRKIPPPSAVRSVGTVISYLRPYKIPPPPAQAKTDGEVLCPYCGLYLPGTIARSKTSWRSHILKDIRPYTCLFEDCDKPLNTYSSTKKWLHHMSTHSRLWRCRGPQHSTISFDREQAFIDHLVKEHSQRNFQVDELPKLADCIASPQEIDFDEDTAADRLLSLALRFLPPTGNSEMQSGSSSAGRRTYSTWNSLDLAGLQGQWDPDFPDGPTSELEIVGSTPDSISEPEFGENSRLSEWGFLDFVEWNYSPAEDNDPILDKFARAQTNQQ